ncbi:MAG: hypothetical protein M3O36_20695 [Myxococcota bacterium]|nr:hypothetical protein [Myxococcota bacterium]
MRYHPFMAGYRRSVAVLVLAACGPSTIVEAESKGDVAWLDKNGTPDAVAALGRLADGQAAARSALEVRSGYDPQVFVAAWHAVERGATWGGAMLRSALADPKQADVAAGAMGKGAGTLAPFVGDLESALVRLSGGAQNYNVSSTLACAGPAARDAIARRLVDASTRGPMCRGIGSKAAHPDARKVLLRVAEASRDDAACVDAVVRAAADDETALAWVAEEGEPGLLGAAGKSDALPCPLLHVAWTRALAARSSEAYPALTVPLSYAVKRCPAEMDGVLADAIAHFPATRAVVVLAIDPLEGYGGMLRATCAGLPTVAAGRETAIVRERAADALSRTCDGLVAERRPARR